MGPHRLPAVAILVLLAMAVPGAAHADEPVIGQLLVPMDHVMPGETFPVTGYDLDEGASLEIRIAAGSAAAELGTGRVAADGTLETVVLLPSTFPVGYAELSAASADGGRWATYVLVGERAEGARAPATDGAVDGRLIALVVLAIGLLIVAGASLRAARR